MLQKLIVIDTEQGFIAKFRMRLGDEDLTEAYEVVPLVPDVTLSFPEMLSRSVADIQDLIASGAVVAAVFVDIVLVEGSGANIDTSGIELAKKLRASQSDLLIYNITSRYFGEAEADALSEATLQDIDGVFIKTYLTGHAFSRRRLRTILDKGRSKRRVVHYAPSPVFCETDTGRKARLTFGEQYLDPRVLQQVREIGEKEFWELLGQLMPDVQSAGVTYMKPGRSGAYVFKIFAKHEVDGIATNAKPWLVKTSRDPASLGSEAATYRQILRTRLNKARYPQLLTPEPTYLGTIGGLAMELQEDALLLADYLCEPGRTEDDARALATRIGTALTDLYGNTIRRVSFVWREHYNLDEKLREAILAFLQDQEALIVWRTSEASFQLAKAFVANVRSAAPHVYDCQEEIDLGFIHGDLNAGNVLITREGMPIFIDFAASCQGHIIKDLAKIERDAFFRLMSHGSPEYYDWPQQGLVQRLAHATGPTTNVEVTTVARSARVVFEFAKTVREQALRSLKGSATSAQYYLALLHYVATAIANEALPIPRRVAGVEYLVALVGVANSKPGRV